MLEGAQRPPNANARDEALSRLKALEQRLLGAKEAVRWQSEFIAEWKEQGLDTAAAEQLFAPAPALSRLRWRSLEGDQAD